MFRVVAGAFAPRPDAVEGVLIMRNQEDLPYILVERDSGGSFGSFCLGALVGAGLALLFAPQSGEETQDEIRVRAQKLRAAAEERMREAQLTLEDRLGNVKDGVESRVELVRDAFESIRVAVSAGAGGVEMTTSLPLTSIPGASSMGSSKDRVARRVSMPLCSTVKYSVVAAESATMTSPVR